LKSRFSDFRKFDWNSHFKRNWIVVSISFLVGAASHIFWDSLTHDHSYFVQAIPVLQNSVVLFGGPIPILKILQHTSTLIGGLVIAFAIYKLPDKKIEKENINLKYWTVVAGLTLTIIIVRLLTGLELNQYGNEIVTAIAGILISLTITPLVTTRPEEK
jgi:fumarate reductase subunit C